MFIETIPDREALAKDWMHAHAIAPVHWYARGPRGGVYEGTGTREMVESHVDPETFIRGVIRVYTKSRGARYLRPGSKAHKAAVAVLDE